MFDLKREVGSLFGFLDSVKSIVHLGTFLWGFGIRNLQLIMTRVLIKRDLFGNRVWRDPSSYFLAGPCFSIYELRNPRSQGHKSGKHLHSACLQIHFQYSQHTLMN